MSRYKSSQEFFEKAVKIIPLASQTFSKSITQYPKYGSPLFMKKSKGVHVWDIDDNKYIDLSSSLGSIILGYCDSDQIKAVKEQLELGTIFPLPGPLEYEVANQIVEMVPSVEKVRFGKNGSDATSAAVRLARAFTKKDIILNCGYHGWHDWYIGTTAKNLGVPEATIPFTKTFPYNDSQACEKLLQENKGNVAAVIIEPANALEPVPGFLEKVRELCDHYGCLLIFDETVTGFRFSKSGAQGLYGVKPDLSCFGKALANGYPVSAIGGRADVMNYMEEIFFSGTFGGELLSLAAANVCLSKINNQNVLDHINQKGEKLKTGMNALLKKYELDPMITIFGRPCLFAIGFKDSYGMDVWQWRTLFFQEIYKRGLISLGTHLVTASFEEEHIKEVLTIYDSVFSTLKSAAEQGPTRFKDFLKVDVLKPLFQVRKS